MPRLSEHEGSGAIGILKAGVRISDVARYHKMPSVNYTEPQRSLPGYWDSQESSHCLVSQEWRPALRGNLRRFCIDDTYIEDIRSDQLLSVPGK